MTAYELRISDVSSDVCSSDLLDRHHGILHRIGDLVEIEPFAVAGTHLDDLGPVARAQNDGLRGLRSLKLTEAGKAVQRHTYRDRHPQACSSEETRVGKAGVRPFGTRWSPSH